MTTIPRNKSKTHHLLVGSNGLKKLLIFLDIFINVGLHIIDNTQKTQQTQDIEATIETRH
jgi:hypothetical protein